MIEHPPSTWADDYLHGRPYRRRTAEQDPEGVMSEVDVIVTDWTNRGKSAKAALRELVNLLDRSSAVPTKRYRHNGNPRSG